MFKTAAEGRAGPGVDSEPTLHRAVKVEQQARRLGMLSDWSDSCQVEGVHNCLQAAIASSCMQVRCVRSLIGTGRQGTDPENRKMGSVRMNLSRGVFPDKPPADLTRDGRAPLTWVY